MPAGETDDRLEEIKKKLYEREGVSTIRRTELPPTSPEVRTTWPGGPVSAADLIVSPAPRRGRVLNFLFVLAIVFFLAAAGLAGWVFWRGGNVVSGDNLDLTIAGPLTVRAGETVSLRVAITNRNRVKLEGVDLLANFPAGTRLAADPSRELKDYREPLGELAPGATVTRTVSAILFGEENSQPEINLGLEYRQAGSNLIASKNKPFRLTISSAPVLVTIDLPEVVSVGNELLLTLSVTSNAETPVDKLVLLAYYPQGFAFRESRPAPSRSNNLWRLPPLAAGEKQTFTIRGRLEGQDRETKTFRVALGLPAGQDETDIGVPYNAVLKTVTLSRPFVGLTLAANGQTGAVAAINNQEPVELKINWANNLSNEIRDGKIELSFVGEALDQNRVMPTGGFYQSANNTVVWTKDLEPALANIAPGQTGAELVRFNTVSLFSPALAGLRNPTIDLTARFTGVRTSPGFPNETVETSQKLVLRLNSAWRLSQRALYHTGPLTNQGPLPPKAGEETSYTIIWSVANSANPASGAKVTATLPSFVNWRNVFLPSNQLVRYDDTTRQITWELGEIPAGTGVTGGPREIAFQVSLLPSLSQVGDKVGLIGLAGLSGIDDFTRQVLRQTAPGADTNLNTDPLFVFGEEKVVK